VATTYDDSVTSLYSWRMPRCYPSMRQNTADRTTKIHRECFFCLASYSSLACGTTTFFMRFIRSVVTNARDKIRAVLVWLRLLFYHIPPM
jgi:hypothetical protein